MRELRCRRHARPRGESLERRWLFAIDRPFIETPLSSTIGAMELIEVVGDFDGDGDDDFVLGSWTNTEYDGRPFSNAWYRLDRESNRLTLAGEIPTWEYAASYRPRVAADIDSDGDLDLVLLVTDYLGGGIESRTRYSWLENADGRGNFTKLHAIIVQGYEWAHLELADIDADGDLDGLLGGEAFMFHAVSGWAENVAGRFTYHATVAENKIPFDDRYLYDPLQTGERRVYAMVPGVTGSAAVDMDHDGDLDLIENSQYSSVVWRENIDGHATFVDRTIVSRHGSYFQVRADDVDRDGVIDVWVQDGSTLQLVWHAGLRSDLVDSLAWPTAGPIVLADVDGDAWQEVIGINDVTNEFAWYDIDGQIQTARLHQGFAQGIEVAQAVADLDGNGLTDIAGRIGWYEQSSLGGAFIEHRYPSSFRPERVAALDLQGDGQAELISLTNQFQTTDSSWRIELSLTRVAIRNGISSFETTQLATHRSQAGKATELRAIDLDADHDLDVAVLIGAHVYWWQNVDGQGQFLARGQFDRMPSVSSLDWLADIDGDDDLDFVTVASDQSNLVWFENRGDQPFTSHQVTPIRLDLSAETVEVVIIDVDGDRDLDLAAKHNGSVEWFKNLDGLGKFPRSGQMIAENQWPLSVKAGDVNGDGDVDLILGTGSCVECLHNERASGPYQRGKFLIYDNRDGQGRFELAASPRADRGTLQIVADIDGDRRVDLVETPFLLPGIIIHRSQSLATDVHDLNGDGQVNLLDLDTLTRAILSQSRDLQFDMNGDRQIDRTDRDEFRTRRLHIDYGDADGDGAWSSADLVQVFQQRTYEQAVDASWASGDWNGDGRFDSTDLVLAMQEGAYVT